MAGESNKLESIMPKALQEERDGLARLLAPIVDGVTDDADAPLHRRLSPEDMDREAADRALSEGVTASRTLLDSGYGTAGMLYGRAMEEQRVRRDLQASRLRHKRLVLGCLETSFRRMLKLDKDMARA